MLALCLINILYFEPNRYIELSADILYEILKSPSKMYGCCMNLNYFPYEAF